jgi:dTDP-4-dehydrorhamnose reductase
MALQTVLVVGGDSVIGSALSQRLNHHGFLVTTSTRRRQKETRHNSVYLDLGQPASFDNINGHHYDSVVFCAAVAALKSCEENPQQTRRINVDGTIALADLLVQEGSHLVFISTNMVFDGKKPFARASDARNPITEYGRQKASVEEHLLLPFAKAAVIRFGKIVSPDFSLFADWIAKLRTGEKIYPYANKNMAPISLSLATEILCWLIISKKLGLYQFTASCDMTYEEAALRLAQLSCSDPLLIESVTPPSINTYQGRSFFDPSFTTLEMSADFSPFFNPPLPYDVLEYAFSSSFSELLPQA